MQATDAASKTPQGQTWFRPDKVAATTPFGRSLQQTYGDLARVDLSLPEGLLVGLGYAATNPGSPLSFHQAQSAAERSGVAGLHQWSIMLPTSARVSQEVYEPLIGIQYPMLCSRKQDDWQIGTTSIRANHQVATGLRFVNWHHSSQNDEAVANPPANQTILTYNHLESLLSRASAGNDAVLVLTTTRSSATALQGHFHEEGKQANAETAVKVAGATARHCIVLHGCTAFLSGNGRDADFDSECYTRANVAFSRATDLTVLARPVNMYGIPGALQVLAALLHGVHTIHTNDSLELYTTGALELSAMLVSEATAAFHEALMPHDPWTGPLPVCLAEHHEGRVRRLRLVLASQSLLLGTETTYMPDGPHFPGKNLDSGLLFGYAPDACPHVEWIVLQDSRQPGTCRLLHNSKDPGRRFRCSQRYQPTQSATQGKKAQAYRFEALRKIYFYDAWRQEPLLNAPGSDLVLPPEAGLLVHGRYWPTQTDNFQFKLRLMPIQKRQRSQPSLSTRLWRQTPPWKQVRLPRPFRSVVLLRNLQKRIRCPVQVH